MNVWRLLFVMLPESHLKKILDRIKRAQCGLHYLAILLNDFAFAKVLHLVTWTTRVRAHPEIFFPRRHVVILLKKK